MRARRAIPIAAALAAILTATGAEQAGCAPADGGGAAGFRCTATAEKPWVVNKRVTGRVVAKCNPSPRTHTVTVQLWAKSIKTGEWKPQGEARTSNELPGTVTLTVLARCHAGLWQTRVTVDSTAVDASGKIQKDHRDRESVVTDTGNRDDC